MREPGSGDGPDGVESGLEGERSYSTMEDDFVRRLQSDSKTSRESALERDSAMFEEGLKMRRKEYGMPGSMPGMMVG